MQIVVLAAFVIVQATPLVCPRPAGWAALLAGATGYLLGTAGLGIFDRALCGDLLQGEGHWAVFRRHRRIGKLSQGWLLVGLAGLCVLGWRGRIIEGLNLARAPLLADLLALLPFFLATLVMWTFEHPFHCASRRRTAPPERAPACWSLREYLEYNLRHNVLFIAVPISLIFLLSDIGRLHLFSEESTADEVGLFVWTLLTVGGVFLIAPLLIRYIWRTHPLGGGDLREGLGDLCRRLGIGYRDILVWRSGNVLANAGAMGLIGRVRYLLISDALLEDLSDEQLRAIFAHEVAHIRCNHIFYSGVFAIAAATCTSAAGWGLTAAVFAPPELRDFFASLSVSPDDVEVTLTVAMLVMAWLWGFGYVSKRFERQSDVIGAWSSGPDRPPSDPSDTTVSPEGVRIFAGALERVAELNGISLHQNNWRHGRMIDRIAYVHSLLWKPAGRAECDRLIRRIKRVLLIALVTGIALTVLRGVLG